MEEWFDLIERWEDHDVDTDNAPSTEHEWIVDRQRTPADSRSGNRPEVLVLPCCRTVSCRYVSVCTHAAKWLQGFDATRPASMSRIRFSKPDHC
jgi:hypothetical protein